MAVDDLAGIERALRPRGLGAARPVPVEATAHDSAATRPRWQRGYVRSLVVADTGAALVAATAAELLLVSSGSGHHGLGARLAFLAGLPALWLVALTLCRAYEPRFLGVGSEEFRRVCVASVTAVAVIGTGSWVLDMPVDRRYALVALPTTALLTLTQRYGVRKALHRARLKGRSTHAVVAVGHTAAVIALVERMQRAQYHGMVVVAACVPGGRQDPRLVALNVPVLGALDDVAAIVEVVRRVDADTVAVTASPELDGVALRRLGWALESTEADLVLSPALMEVVGPRLAIRPVCGLPLLHVERPELVGIRRIGKGVVDRVAATLAVLVLSPVVLVIAAAIRIDSRGPVFFRQTRVGRDGREFTMLKFRTMVADAEAQRLEILAANEAAGPLFKMRRDPRVTRVGRRLRKYSLDELPQLLNVLAGSMSLVGPRPSLPVEAAEYEDHVRRRFLVKPGLTGLWQINGRSDLTWDESVRLDLRYVENWSFAFDFMILWKTASAVLRGRGAY